MLKKKTTKKQMVSAEAQLVFWLHGGGSLVNLKELAHALKSMSDDTFAHHVTDKKNDFVKWTTEVLHETELAAKLSKIKKRLTAYRAVEEYIKANY